MAAGAVFRIVFVIVRASPSPGFDLSMHMRERPARCAGPPFRGTFVPQGTDRIGREKSQAAIAAPTGVSTFAVRAAQGRVPARRPAPGALGGTASGSAADGEPAWAQDELPVLPDPVPRDGERALARVGLLGEGAEPVFVPGAKIPLAGLLLALPALAGTGLI